jgi:hypothetical protein
VSLLLSSPRGRRRPSRSRCCCCQGTSGLLVAEDSESSRRVMTMGCVVVLENRGLLLLERCWCDVPLVTKRDCCCCCGRDVDVPFHDLAVAGGTFRIDRNGSLVGVVILLRLFLLGSKYGSTRTVICKRSVLLFLSVGIIHIHDCF